MNKEKTKSLVTIPKEDYLKLLEAYKKLGEVSLFKKSLTKKKKEVQGVKSLYGIWEGVKVDEEDFEAAKRSLFKTSL